MGERHQFILIRGLDRDGLLASLRRCAEEVGKKLQQGKPTNFYTVPYFLIGQGDGCANLQLGQWNEVVSQLLKVTQAPLANIRAQEGDHWDYSLLQNGAVIDDFSTKPNYWEDDDPHDPRYESKKGKPDVLAAAWGIPVERIEKYLVNWEMNSGDGVLGISRIKAYPEDRTAYGDVFQANDFARALGAHDERNGYEIYHAE